MPFYNCSNQWDVLLFSIFIAFLFYKKKTKSKHRCENTANIRYHCYHSRLSDHENLIPFNAYHSYNKHPSRIFLSNVFPIQLLQIFTISWHLSSCGNTASNVPKHLWNSVAGKSELNECEEITLSDQYLILILMSE